MSAHNNIKLDQIKVGCLYRNTSSTYHIGRPYITSADARDKVDISADNIFIVLGFETAYYSIDKRIIANIKIMINKKVRWIPYWIDRIEMKLIAGGE